MEAARWRPRSASRRAGAQRVDAARPARPSRSPRTTPALAISSSTRSSGTRSARRVPSAWARCDDADGELVAARPVGLERLRVGKRPRHHVLESAIGRLHVADPFHVAPETGPAVRCLEGLLSGARVLLQAMLEAGGDEVVAGGEAPVDGGDADAGLFGDLFEGDVQPVLGEGPLCGLHDALPVAHGICPQCSIAGSVVSVMRKRLPHIWRISSISCQDHCYAEDTFRLHSVCMTLGAALTVG